MRSLSALLVAAVLAACSHAVSTTTPGPTGSWKGADVLANVPADTPYVFALLEPPPEPIRKRMWGNVDAKVLAALDEANATPLDARLQLSPEKRAWLGVLDAARGKDPAKWLENLGLKRDARFMMYGLGIWPVVRMEVADAGKLRGILSDAVKTLNQPVMQEKHAGAFAYWVASGHGVSVIVSITEHDAVAALVPTVSVDATVPLVLGTKSIGKSLRDSGEVGRMMDHHHFASTMIAYLDSHRIIDALERRDDLATTSVFTAPACHADYERMAAALPRIVFGYTQLDAQGFGFAMAADTSPEVAKQLAALHTSLPPLPDVRHALMAMAVAVDVDSSVTVVRGWLQQLVDHPFQCEQFAHLTPFVAEALQATQHLIPSEFKGLKGGEFVIDDATASPPSGSGYAMIVGDQIAIELGELMKKVPGMGGLAIAPDGQPVALPVSMAGIPGLDSAHLALHPSRAVLAVGDHSKTEVATALGAQNAAHSPLAAIVWDVAKTMRQIPSMMKGDDSHSLDVISTMTMGLDVRDDSIVFDVTATWAK